MAGVAGYADVVHDHDEADVVSDIRESVMAIRGECIGVVRDGQANAPVIARLRAIDTELDRIADALDDVARRPEPIRVIDLSDLARRAVARVGPIATQLGVHVAVVGSQRTLSVCGGGELIERVIDNLIIAAVSCTPAGARVTIAVDHGGADGALCISGGVDGNDERVGWGLTRRMVSAIVRSQGGHIHFAVADGVATAWITLPRAAES